MKAVSKISKKGQVIIPKNFRKFLGIEPGDRVVFILTEQGVLIQKEEESPFDKYFGFLKAPASSEELVRKMRGERDDIGD